MRRPSLLDACLLVILPAGMSKVVPLLAVLGAWVGARLGAYEPSGGDAAAAHEVVAGWSWPACCWSLLAMTGRCNTSRAAASATLDASLPSSAVVCSVPNKLLLVCTGSCMELYCSRSLKFTFGHTSVSSILPSLGGTTPFIDGLLMGLGRLCVGSKLPKLSLS
jgi:hypothetical protein